MPITKTDLRRWEREGDLDKFFQIIKYLNDEKHRSEWHAAIKALKRIHSPQGIYPLLLAASEEGDEGTASATAALVNWGPEIIDPLCRYSLDFEQLESIRHTALKILNNFTDPLVSETYLTIIQKGDRISGALIEWIGQMESLETVIAAVGNGDPGRRYAAIKALADSGKHNQVWNPIVAALKDDDVQVRAAALDTLFYLLRSWKEGDKKYGADYVALVLDPLILASEDEDFFVRKESTYCLRVVEDKLAMDVLIRLLKDPFDFVREAAMIALSHYQDESNLTLFREIYSNIAETIDIRKTAVRAIIINSKAQAAQLLVDMLENENNIELCKVAIYVAGNLEIHETVNVLLQFIKSSKRDVVYEALRAIEKIKDPLSIEALLAQFDEEEEPTFLKVYCKIFRNLKARDALEPMIIKMANLEAEGVNYFSEKIEGILEPETLKEYIEKMKGPRNVRLRNGIQRLKQFVASQKDGEYPKFPIPDL